MKKYEISYIKVRIRFYIDYQEIYVEMTKDANIYI